MERQEVMGKKKRLKVPGFARGGHSPCGEIPNRPMKQGQVWQKLRDAFYQEYPTGNMVRIENQVERGTPDIYYCSGSRSGWLEIKTGYQKPTALQKAWHEAERSAGGRVGILTVKLNKAMLDFGYGRVYIDASTWSEVVSKLW